MGRPIHPRSIDRSDSVPRRDWPRCSNLSSTISRLRPVRQIADRIGRSDQLNADAKSFRPCLPRRRCAGRMPRPWTRGARPEHDDRDNRVARRQRRKEQPPPTEHAVALSDLVSLPIREQTADLGRGGRHEQKRDAERPADQQTESAAAAGESRAPRRDRCKGARA